MKFHSISKILFLALISNVCLFINPVFAGGPPLPIAPLPTGNTNLDSVGTALHSACLSATGAFSTDCDAALNASGQSLGALTPDEIMANNTNITSTAVNDSFSRLGQLRQFGYTPSVMAGLNGSSAIGGGASSDSIASRLGVYVNGHTAWQEYNQQSLNPGYKLFDSRAVIGADYRFTDNFIAGLSSSYLSSDTELKRGAGKIDTDGYSFSIYGSYSLDNLFFVDATFAYADQSHKTVRNVAYTGVNQLASANVSSDTYSAGVVTGYNFNFDAWTVTPTARWMYRSIQLENYLESLSNPGGAGGSLGLAIGEQQYESITGNFGVQVSYSWGQTWGVLIPHFGAEYVHEFANNSTEFSGSFVNAPTGTGGFTINNTAMDKDYATLTAGFSSQFAHGISAFVLYEKIIDLKSLTSDALSMGLRMELD